MENEIVLFESEDDQVKLNVEFDGETVWLTKEQMAALFGRDRSVISRHISNIFREGEILEEGNVHYLHIANSDKPVAFYNLDAIISVGYRVKSKRGVEFRKWATDSTTGTIRSPPVCFSTFLTGTGYFFVMVQRLSVMMCSLPPRS